MILAGFLNRHYALFRYGAQRAKALFESGDWHADRQLSRERIEYYDMRVRECILLVQKALKLTSQDVVVERIRSCRRLSARSGRRSRQTISSYSPTTVSPSVRRRSLIRCPAVLHRDYFHNDFTNRRSRPTILTAERPVYRSYYPSRDGLRKTLSCAWSTAWRRL